MIDFSESFNPLILDVAFFVLLTIALLVGFLKGFKKVSIEFLIKIASFILAFSSALSFLKKFILDSANLDFTKIEGISTLPPLLVYLISLAAVMGVSLLVYFVVKGLLELMVWLFKKALRIKKKPKHIVNRIFGALVNGLLSFVFLALLLRVSATPLFGFDHIVNQTTVTSKIVNVTDKVLTHEKIIKYTDDAKVIPALIDGNIFTYGTVGEKAASYRSSYNNLVNTFANYEVQYAAAETQEAKDNVAYKMMEDVAVITDLAVMVSDEYANIVPATDNLIANAVSFFVGSNITLSDELKNNIGKNMLALNGNEAIRANLFSMIGFVPQA